MTVLRSLSLVAAASVVTSCSPIEESVAERLPPTTLERLDEIASSVFEEARAPALSAAIVEDGRLLWSAAYGHSDAEGTVPASAETRYRIGSVSKVVTAMIAASLVEQGVVDWTTPASDYISGLPGESDEVTLRRLADHTAAIRHYRTDEDRAIRPAMGTAGEALALFIEDPYAGAPGERYSYSSYGYTLLAAVLESASGKSFPTLLEETIHGRYSLSAIATDQVGDPHELDAAVFDGLENVPARDISYKWAGGGLRASMPDLAAFGWLSTRPGQIFTAETIAQIATRGEGLGGTTHRHGVGWVVDTLTTGETVLFHDGEVQGGHAHLLSIPDWNMSAAIAVNRGSFFSVSQGLALLCAARGVEECPQPVGQRSIDEKVGRAVADLERVQREWSDLLAEGDMRALTSVVSSGFDSESWPNRSALESALRDALADGPLVRVPSETHVQIGGVEAGAITRISGLYYDRLFTEDRDLVLFFAYDGESWSLVRMEPRDAP